jgi:hypothetical protein
LFTIINYILRKKVKSNLQCIKNLTGTDLENNCEILDFLGSDISEIKKINENNFRLSCWTLLCNKYYYPPFGKINKTRKLFERERIILNTLINHL